MIGNGPFKLEEPRTDQEIVARPQRRVGRRHLRRTRRRSSTRSPSVTSADPDTAYNAFEAGEGDNANIPPGRVQEAQENYAHHARRRHPGLVPLRVQADRPGRRRPGEQAAPPGDLAGDRPRGDQRGGLRGHPHRRRPASRRPASRASRRASATTAPTTRKRPSRRSTTGRPQATRSTEPIQIQFNAGAGHEDVVADHHRQPRGDRHRGRGRSRSRRRRTSPSWPTAPARSAVRVGTPTTRRTTTSCTTCSTPTSIGGNNHGFYSNPEFDDLVDEAKQTTDADEQGELFNQAEDDPAQRGHRCHPDQLVPGRLRLQPGRASRTSRRPPRSDPVGAGRRSASNDRRCARSGGGAVGPPPNRAKPELA